MRYRFGHPLASGDTPVFTDGTHVSPITLDTDAVELAMPENAVAVNVVADAAFQVADAAAFDAGYITVPANTVVRVSTTSASVFVKALSGSPKLSFWFDTVEV